MVDQISPDARPTKRRMVVTGSLIAIFLMSFLLPLRLVFSSLLILAFVAVGFIERHAADLLPRDKVLRALVAAALVIYILRAYFALTAG